MEVEALAIDGAYLLNGTANRDEPGRIGAEYIGIQLSTAGLDVRLAYVALSRNRKAGTIRGLHLQLPPYAEVKVIRCTLGRFFMDVIVDCRHLTPTFGSWISVELAADVPSALYVPHGCAHGFQTLEDDTQALYCIEGTYNPGSAITILWNDPDLKVAWPVLEGPLSSRAIAMGRRLHSFAIAFRFGGLVTMNVIIWRALGRCLLLSELFMDLGYRVLAVFDNDTNAQSPLPGVPLSTTVPMGSRSHCLYQSDQDGVAANVAIGGERGAERLHVQALLADAGLAIATAVHARAFVARDAEIGSGSQILAMSAVASRARLGAACIINTSASVGITGA